MIIRLAIKIIIAASDPLFSLFNIVLSLYFEGFKSASSYHDLEDFWKKAKISIPAFLLRHTL
jgi:hypothetical protein